MSSRWTGYAAVVLVSIGVGVAISGLPDDAPVDGTIVAPASAQPAVVPLASLPSANTTTPITTDVTSTVRAVTVAPATSTTNVVSTTAPPTTIVPTTMISLIERGDLLVLVANGVGTPGLAGRTIDELCSLGYTRGFKTDGTTPIERSIVFASASRTLEGRRLAADLGFADTRPRPIENAPTVEGGRGNIQLLVYLGRARA